MINNISFPNLGLNFNINRAAFSIGNVNIYWYGLIIALGMIIALAYGIREFKRCGLKQDDLLKYVFDLRAGCYNMCKTLLCYFQL